VRATGGERIGAAVIPEVWALFERPRDEGAFWYLERQLDRWRMATEATATHGIAVLDGDPFQPLWYRWAYGYSETLSLSATIAFLREAIVSRRLAFPNRYFLLRVSEPELRARKQSDASRSRRSFEKHVALLRHQPRYFATLDACCPGLVSVLDASMPPETLADAAASAIDGHSSQPPIERFDHVAAWLGRTTAGGGVGPA
jgi:hypothetical protein